MAETTTSVETVPPITVLDCGSRQRRRRLRPVAAHSAASTMDSAAPGTVGADVSTTFAGSERRHFADSGLCGARRRVESRAVVYESSAATITLSTRGPIGSRSARWRLITRIVSVVKYLFPLQ